MAKLCMIIRATVEQWNSIITVLIYYQSVVNLITVWDQLLILTLHVAV